MSFGDAIQTVFRTYAEFSGRAGRAEFWWWTLFNVLVLSALNVLNAFPVGENAYLGSVLDRGRRGAEAGADRLRVQREHGA